MKMIDMTSLDLMDSTDETFCFDNTALFDILTKTLRLSAGNFAQVNQLLAQVMIGVTACFRFPGMSLPLFIEKPYSPAAQVN